MGITAGCNDYNKQKAGGAVAALHPQSPDQAREPARRGLAQAPTVRRDPTRELGKSAAAPAKPSDKPAHSRRYQNQLWVTRHRPGVDRVFSAWLLRRFIDRRGRFTFASRESVPAKAIPFDMFQGGFGHRGEDCTFETLRKEFRVRDAGVATVGEMVHDADLNDGKFGRKEAFGVDEVLKGWTRKGTPDKDLLERGMEMIEGLCHSVS